MHVGQEAGVGELTGLPAMCDGLFVVTEKAQRGTFERECQPAQRIAWTEPKRGIVIWEASLRLAGAIDVGKAEAIMTPGEVGIDRDRGLHLSNRHLGLTGEDMHLPQGEMRHRFVGIERYRLFGRRSR